MGNCYYYFKIEFRPININAIEKISLIENNIFNIREFENNNNNKSYRAWYTMYSANVFQVRSKDKVFLSMDTAYL